MFGLNWMRWALWIILLGVFGAWISWVLQQAPAPKIDWSPHGESITIDGVKLHFVQKGEGPAVVVLPGVPLHAESMAKLLAWPWDHRRIYILDLPEQGFSEKNGRSYSPDDYALVLKLFFDKLEIHEADVIGHDLGAGVALVFAASYPLKVKRLALISPPLESGSLEASWRQWPGLGEVWSSLFLSRDWLRAWLAQGWKTKTVSWETVIEQYYQPWNSMKGRGGFLAVWRGSMDFSYKPYAERLQAPVLVLLGALDPFARPEPLRRWQTGHAQVTLNVLPGVGHFPTDEAPEAVYAALREFLSLAPLPAPAAAPAPTPAVSFSRPMPARQVVKKKTPANTQTRGGGPRVAPARVLQPVAPTAEAASPEVPRAVSKAAGSGHPVSVPTEAAATAPASPGAEPAVAKPATPEPVSPDPPAASPAGDSPQGNSGP